MFPTEHFSSIEPKANMMTGGSGALPTTSHDGGNNGIKVAQLTPVRNMRDQLQQTIAAKNGTQPSTAEGENGLVGADPSSENVAKLSPPPAVLSPPPAVNGSIAVSNNDLAEILGMFPKSKGGGMMPMPAENNNNVYMGMMKPCPDPHEDTRESEGKHPPGNGGWGPPADLPPKPKIDQNWQPPQDLPPEIDQVDGRFSCPPTSLDPSLDQQIQMVASTSLEGGILGTESAESSWKVSESIEASSETSPQQSKDSKKADAEAQKIVPEISQSPNIATTPSKQIDGHNSDDDSLFGDTEDEDDEEEEGEQKQQTQEKESSPSHRSSHDLSDDDASLFGSSDDEEDQAMHEDPKLSSSSVHSPAQGSGKIAIFHPPTATKADLHDSDCVSSDEGSVYSINDDKEDDDDNNKKPSSSKGGFLGGLLSKVKKTSSSSRDVKSFGTSGYKIQRKDTSRKKETKKLNTKKVIHGMNPPPPRAASQKTMQIGRQQVGKEEMEKMVEVVRQSREKQLEKRQLQQQAKASPSSAFKNESPGKKSVTLSEDAKVPKYLGKSARALDNTTGLHSNSASGAKSTSAAKQASSSNVMAKVASKRADTEFDKNFAMLQQYIHTHGDCNVPSGHSLKRWIVKQRNICSRWLNHSNDDADGTNLERHSHIARLLSVNFDWGTISKARAMDALAAEATLISSLTQCGNGGSKKRDMKLKKRKNKDVLVNSKKSVFESISSKKRQRQPNSNNDDDGEEEHEFTEESTSIADLTKKGMWTCNCGVKILSTKLRCGSCCHWRGGKRKGGWKIKSSNGHNGRSGVDQDWSCCGEVVPAQKKRCRKCQKWSGGKRGTVATKTVTDSSDEGAAHASNKSNSKKRLKSDECGEVVDEDGFVDEQPDFISWNDTSKQSRKRRKMTLSGMSPNQWVDLLVNSKNRYSQADTFSAAEEQRTKCWSNLEDAISNNDESSSWVQIPSVFDGSAERKKVNPAPSSTARKKNFKQTSGKQFKKTSAINAKSSPKLKARTLLKTSKSEIESSIPTFRIGKRVYAAWWKTKSRSGPATYYPGAIESFKLTHNNTKVLYTIKFDDGDRLSNIDANLIIPRKKYLKQNLKPLLKAGDEVYAAWWEVGRRKHGTEALWFPGVVRGYKERPCGGRYGLFRLYDVVFDDGDELDATEDYFVMNKSDYLISTRNGADSDDDDDGDDNAQTQWIGVKNNLDKSSIDTWAKDVGWYSFTIDGNEQSFPLLSDALRAYDAHTVQRKGPKTKMSDLNLPELWAFPSPYGICPPVYIGGTDDDDDHCVKEKEDTPNTSKGDSNPDLPRQAEPTAESEEKHSLFSNVNKPNGSNKGKADLLSSNDDKKHYAGPNVVKLNPHTKVESNLLSSSQVSSTANDAEKTISLNASPNSWIDAAKVAPSQLANEVNGHPHPVMKIGPLNTLEQVNHSGKAHKPDKTLPPTTISPLVQDNLNKPTNNASCDAPMMKEDKTIDPRKKLPCDSKPPPSSTSSDPQKHSFKSNDSSLTMQPANNSSITELLDETATKPEPSVPSNEADYDTKMSANNDKDALLAWGRTRSTAKAILDLIDSTNPEATTNSANINAPPESSITNPLEQSSSNSCSRRPSLSDRQSKCPALPAEGLPKNWTVRKIPRLSTSKKSKAPLLDHFYYSPLLGHRFRSKTKVGRFLECLKTTNGDEERAMKEFRGSMKRSSSPNSVDAGEAGYDTKIHDDEAEEAALSLGYTRATKKAILDLIDMTNPETKPESSTNNATADASATSSGKRAPHQKPVPNWGSRLTLSEKETKYPALPAAGFPENWTMRKIPRSNGSVADSYYYSPQMGHCFRSKPEVGRFLGWLKRTNGDEDKALKELRGSARRSSISPTMQREYSFNAGEAGYATKKSATHVDEAKAALGHTRSTTKVIYDLIDMTNPESKPECSTYKSPVDAPATDSANAAPKKTASNSNPETKPESWTNNAAADSPATDSATMAPERTASKPCSHPTLSLRDSKYPAKSAEGYPTNWTVRKIPRSKGSHVDIYYYSPQKLYRFRSKKEVCRFLDCLGTNGDEEMAIKEFHGSTKKSPKSGYIRSSRTKPSAPPCIASRFKVVEYIEPSKTFDENSEEKKIDGKEEVNKKELKQEISNAGVQTNGYVKPVMKRGERVYACWTDPESGKGDIWYPGRVWDIKEHPGCEYGPVKKYDVVFDDGDTESNVEEIWLLKKDEYEMNIQKPDEEWIGVTNKRFPESKDDYARLMGWYVVTYVDGVDQVYPSLGEALREYDKHLIEAKGRDKLSAKELNFPGEHNIA